VSKHAHKTHPIFGLIPQGPEGLSAGGLSADTKQPGSHRPCRTLVSGCHSSKAALRRCFTEKLVPSLYSYPHLLCLPNVTEEFRDATSSQAPSAQKLQHKILKGHHFSGRLFSLPTLSKPVAFEQVQSFCL